MPLPFIETTWMTKIQSLPLVQIIFGVSSTLNNSFEEMPGIRFKTITFVTWILFLVKNMGSIRLKIRVVKHNLTTYL